MKNTVHPKDVGSFAEQAVILDCLKQGHSVATVIGDNDSYDLIVDNGTRLYRVQVKCRTPVDGKISVENYTMTYKAGTDSSNNRSKMNKYNNSFDYFAIVNNDTFEIYYIPVSKLNSGCSTFTIRLIPTKNNQKSSAFIAEEFLILE